MTDGKCLPTVGFEGTVNGEVYLDLLHNTMWHFVRGSSIGTSMTVRHNLLRGHAWTFFNQSFTTASYPVIWNINCQRILQISQQRTLHFRIRPNQKIWRVSMKKLSGRCFAKPEIELLSVYLFEAAIFIIQRSRSLAFI